MKIAYITTENLKHDMGVHKKINGQVQVMRKSEIDTVLIGTSDGEIVLKEKDNLQKLGTYNDKSPFRFFNLTRSLYKRAYQYIKDSNIDAVYIRYSFSEPSLIKFLRNLKEISVKIFIEIPSFPYDSEYDNKKMYKKLGLCIDKWYRRKLHKYVDIIYTPSPGQENIYNIETVYFNNAINVSSIRRRKYDSPKENKLRLIGVANLNAWHGYDRVIKGIHKYYEESSGEIEFVFNVVGDGVELNNLKELTKELELEDRVIFHGRKYGKDLDELYDNSDVAVSSLGLFRVHSEPRTTLKAREACAQGIPFIAVKGDPVFDDNFDYVCFVEDKEVPLDVLAVYEWFQGLNQEQYLDDMYKFSIKNLGWEENFRPVILSMKEIIEDDNRGSSR
jgi:glycosyltransferase involved in cell wall biosynthesis